MQFLERTFTLRISECDVNNTWRPGAILTEMQEIAGEHSAGMGCSREELLRCGVAWVVSRLELQMIRYPVSGEQITLKTFHRPTRHRFFPRLFEIRDSENRLIGQASSLWVLMDLKTRQSVSADRLPVPLPDNSDAPELMPLPGSIPQLSGEEKILPWEVLYTDLDPNQHVNNTKYADWLCNALGTETMTKRQITGLNIHFNSEVRPGQHLELRLRQEKDLVQMTGTADGGAAFEIGCTLK